MKAPRILALAATLLTGAVAAFILHPSSLIHAQGPLTPPGAPAPTMKTLDQLEPRIPISTVPFIIDSPGSYYLTGDLSTGTAAANAITINTNRVTLDLNGFTISSSHTTGFGSGISIPANRQAITIRNGRIQGTTTYSAPTFTQGGFLTGVSGSSSTNTDIVVEDLIVTGIAGNGISLNSADYAGTVARRCNVNTASTSGILASRVESCNVNTAGGFGISAQVVHSSTARSVGTASTNDGISADTVYDSHGSADAGNGIDANDSASDSTGNSVSGIGLRATTAINCRGASNGNLTGLSSAHATSCRGTSSAGIGLSGSNATNCEGTSSTNIGLSALNAMNSRGFSTDATGLLVTHASNCHGTSINSIGLSAVNATNSTGTTTSGTAGLDVSTGTASYCRGNNSSGGTAISARIAIGCTVATGTVASPSKFLGTP